MATLYLFLGPIYKHFCGLFAFHNPAQIGTSGGTIRRELDFQTRVRVLASTLIPIGNVGDEKKMKPRTEDVLSGR